MTEKRFTKLNMGLDGQFIKDNGKIMLIDDVVDLLNEQHEEIQSLKLDLEEMIEIKNKYKQESRDYSEMFDKLSIENNKQHEENEQLKQQNEHLEKQIKCITQLLQNELNNYGFR